LIYNGIPFPIKRLRFSSIYIDQNVLRKNVRKQATEQYQQRKNGFG